MAGRQTDSKIQPKRRKVTNSKKGTISICKAPAKGGKDKCGKRYIVNTDRLKDHKYCCNACNTRASYYNKKKKQKKLAKEIKKYKVLDEIELIEVKNSIYWLEQLINSFNEALKPLHQFNLDNQIFSNPSYIHYQNQLAFYVEQFLPLIVEFDLKSGTLYKDKVFNVKKQFLFHEHILIYLLLKQKMVNDNERLWIATMKGRVPHFNPRNGIDLFKDLNLKKAGIDIDAALSKYFH